MPAEGIGHFPLSGETQICEEEKDMSQRDQILRMNPDAILLSDVFDSAIVGVAEPLYVHQPEVWVAVYDRNKVRDIVHALLEEQHPDEDKDWLASVCGEETEALWNTAVGPDRRKHLPVVIERLED